MADDPETPPKKRQRDSLEGGAGPCDSSVEETKPEPTVANVGQAKVKQEPPEDATALNCPHSEAQAAVADYQVKIKNEPPEYATVLNCPHSEAQAAVADYQVKIKNEPHDEASTSHSPSSESKVDAADYQLMIKSELQDDAAALNHSNNSPTGECSSSNCSSTSKFLDPETVHDRILIVNGKKFYVLEEMFSPHFKAKLAETSGKEVHLPGEYFGTTIDPEDFVSFLKFLYWKKDDRNVKNVVGLMGLSSHFKEDDFWKAVCLKHIRDEMDFPEQVELFEKMLSRNFPRDRVGDVMHVVYKVYDSGRYIESYSDILWKLGEDYELDFLKEAVSHVCHGFFFDATTRDKFIIVELALRYNMKFLKDEVSDYLKNFLYPRHREEIRKKMPDESGDGVAQPAPTDEEEITDDDVKYPVTTHGGIYGFLIENRDRLRTIAADHKAFIMDSILYRGTDVLHRDVCMVSEYARRKDSRQHTMNRGHDYNFSDQTREHDTALVVSGKKFFVKKGFLKLESKYLNNLLSSGTEGDIILQMEDVTSDDFEEFLAALYMASKFPFTKENVAGLLRMANKFEIGDHECSIWENCQSFIENKLSIINIAYVLEEMVKNCVRTDKFKKVVDVLSVNMKSHFPQMDDLTTVVRIASKYNINDLLTEIGLICMNKFDKCSSAEKYAFVELAIENNMDNLKTRIAAFLSNFVLKWDRSEEFIREQDLQKECEQVQCETQIINGRRRIFAINKKMLKTETHKEERKQRDEVYSFLLRHRESILSASTEVKAFLFDSMLAK